MLMPIVGKKPAKEAAAQLLTKASVGPGRQAERGRQTRGRRAQGGRRSQTTLGERGLVW
jgi:hypothetical protein